MLRTLFVLLALASPAFAVEFRAGVASIDVTPEKFPVVVNCGFVEASDTSAHNRTNPLRQWRRMLRVYDGKTFTAHVPGCEPVPLGPWIGGRMDKTGLFGGCVAGAAVFNVALTPEQIVDRARGRARSGAPTP